MSLWKNPLSREKRVKFASRVMSAITAYGIWFGFVDPHPNQSVFWDSVFLLLSIAFLIVIAVLIEHGVYLAVINQDLPPKEKFLARFFAGFVFVIALYITLSLTWFFETKTFANPAALLVGLYSLAGFLRYDLKFRNHKND